MPDFLYQGTARGEVASTLLANNMDVNMLRPWLGKSGKTYVTRFDTNGKPKKQLVTNAAATLRKEDWLLLDRAIVKAAQPRMRAVSDLRSAGLQFTLPNGMAHTVLQTETQTDLTPAIISMDGVRRSDADRPEFDLVNLPLPIIHKDFNFTARQVLVSRNGGSALDTTTAELAAQRVAEEAEKLTLGETSSYAYGGGTIYGYTNFPDRLTATPTLPTAGGWTPSVTVDEVLSMRQQAYDAYHFGPFFLYNSPGWDQYFDADYSAAKGDNTLRQRLAAINGIDSVATLDWLTDHELLLVQKSSAVARMVVGMDITTVQWESLGGMNLHFKVMAILVPQVRSDANSNTGIVHGTAA